MTQLQPLLTALDASPGALHRPICRGWAGDMQITGKFGHIFADDLGFLLYVGTDESPRRWTNVKRKLAFARLTQDGDDEGCFHLDHLPTSAEAEAIREAIGIRRRRHLTPEARAVLVQRLSRTGSPSNGPSIAPIRPAATPIAQST